MVLGGIGPPVHPNHPLEGSSEVHKVPPLQELNWRESREIFNKSWVAKKCPLISHPMLPWATGCVSVGVPSVCKGALMDVRVSAWDRSLDAVALRTPAQA